MLVSAMYQLDHVPPIMDTYLIDRGSTAGTRSLPYTCYIPATAESFDYAALPSIARHPRDSCKFLYYMVRVCSS